VFEIQVVWTCSSLIFPDLNFVYTSHISHMCYIFSHLKPFALLRPNSFQ